MNLQPFESVLARNPFADSALIEEGARQFERLLEEVRREEEAAAEKARQEAREAFLKRLGSTSTSQVTKPVAKPKTTTRAQPDNVIKLKAPAESVAPDRTLRWTKRSQAKASAAWKVASRAKLTGRNAELKAIIATAQTADRESAFQAMNEAVRIIRSADWDVDDRLIGVAAAWGQRFRSAMAG